MAKKKSSLDELKKLKEDFQKKARKVFDKEFAELAGKIPNAEKIMWNQYTPYFNDGDECTFRINDAVVVLKDSEIEECYWELEGQDLTEKQSAALSDLNELLNSEEMETVLLDMFDNHVEITYTIETGEFEVDSYDHD